MVKRPSFVGNVVSENAGAVGDTGETVIPLTKLKASEAFDSALVMELTAGTQFEVVEVGEAPNRIRVTTPAGHAGWISKATEQGKPIVKWVRKRHTSFSKDNGMERKTSGDHATKSVSGDMPTKDGLVVGDVCETVIQGMTLRESEDFRSAALGQIPEGTQFEVVSTAPANRVKVIVPSSVLEGGAVGWISSHTDAGKKLVKVIKSGPGKKRKSFNLAGSLSIPLGQGQQKATVEAVPPGMRLSLLPVRESRTTPDAHPASVEKAFLEEPGRSETQESPDATESVEVRDAKARARAQKAGEMRRRASAARAPRAVSQPTWWARLACCSG
ncbi:unnamed protein product [Prorocentrum cordatum]|uniref:50S ribosomal protein L24, chloroplastic n=1 Tax=Prorocentrum cordatum TaxID=2364126 RepID=A0ABN9UCH0_9DINO|nr:unnamed protein product [Polarella glacialis]